MKPGTELIAEWRLACTAEEEKRRELVARLERYGEIYWLDADGASIRFSIRQGQIIQEPVEPVEA